LSHLAAHHLKIKIMKKNKGLIALTVAAVLMSGCVEIESLNGPSALNQPPNAEAKAQYEASEKASEKRLETALANEKTKASFAECDYEAKKYQSTAPLPSYYLDRLPALTAMAKRRKEMMVDCMALKGINKTLVQDYLKSNPLQY
jgi:hypothetical protein